MNKDGAKGRNILLTVYTAFAIYHFAEFASGDATIVVLKLMSFLDFAPVYTETFHVAAVKEWSRVRLSPLHILAKCEFFFLEDFAIIF